MIMPFIRYRAADPGYRAMLNRLRGRTIGAAAVLGKHCYSWVWSKAPRPDGTRWPTVVGIAAAVLAVLLIVVALAAMVVTLSVTITPMPPGIA
jgi:hypothetical protein